MTRSDILARIQKVASETFGCAPELVHEGTVAADIEKWDSLRHLIFMGGVEQEFDIEFDMDSIAQLTNVSDLINLIEQLAR